MAEEKKEPWLNLLALTTVILAVCATLATFKGGGFSTRSMLRQIQASDGWAHYQGKSIKGNLYEVERDRLGLELKELEGGKPSAKQLADLKEALAATEKKVAKYDAEKAELSKEAKRLEQERDEASKHSQAFGLAVIFLQIAILLSSIAALLKRKEVYYLGLAVGAVGVVYFLNGFWLFIKP